MRSPCARLGGGWVMPKYQSPGFHICEPKSGQMIDIPLVGQNILPDGSFNCLVALIQYGISKLQISVFFWRAGITSAQVSDWSGRSADFRPAPSPPVMTTQTETKMHPTPPTSRHSNTYPKPKILTIANLIMKDPARPYTLSPTHVLGQVKVNWVTKMGREVGFWDPQ